MASRLFHSASNNKECIRYPMDVPYFAIYYNDVYEVDLPPGHRFPMKKYRIVREALQAKVDNLREDEKGRVRCEFHVSPCATEAQLVTTHDARYVRRYLTGEMTESENRNIGFPWSLKHVNRTLSSVGGTVAAATAAWEEYSRRREYLEKVYTQEQQIQTRPRFLNEKTMHLCWAVIHQHNQKWISSQILTRNHFALTTAHVAGGTHHAFADYGEGFCIFSDIAVAANVLLERYSPLIRRILIIDLDVHQGNGNAALFDKDDRVQTFSMHCIGNYFSKKEKSDLDVELPIGCDDETYLSTLRYWLKRIDQHRFDESFDAEQNCERNFDFIFFQSGVDIHKDDRLGRLHITADGISKRNAIVFDFAHRMKCPLVICMGGGYPKDDDWSPIIDSHVGVYWEAHRYLSTILDSSHLADVH
ncbi:LOW QUALITY PROTEIN: hypothetical protein ACHAXA_003797 [Cyclostephanos tholiformis]|uniref:Histone deacetylase domain-containing protein n=1 Tax=Cyclostephanos tholiformis TaxID=382380 RepID=A0ABD3R7F3_9STRA